MSDTYPMFIEPTKLRLLGSLRGTMAYGYIWLDIEIVFLKKEENPDLID